MILSSYVVLDLMDVNAVLLPSPCTHSLMPRRVCPELKLSPPQSSPTLPISPAAGLMWRTEETLLTLSR